MRRSFKAATVFTGVAALAGGFAPAAFAATARPATVHPEITWKECGANDTNEISEWVHLYYPNDDHPAECFGGVGKHSVTAAIASFCPGNNSGIVSGSADGYSHQEWTFVQGAGRKPVDDYDGGWFGDFAIDYLSINDFGGSAKCD
jgi:hypothetical protein